MLKCQKILLGFGLPKLKNLTKSKKDDPLACLRRNLKEEISTEEEWLHNAANPVKTLLLKKPSSTS
jgi:hypothetical protein